MFFPPSLFWTPKSVRLSFHQISFTDYHCYSVTDPGSVAVRFSGRHNPIPGGNAYAVQAAKTRETNSSHLSISIGCVSVVISNSFEDLDQLFVAEVCIKILQKFLKMVLNINEQKT